MPQWWWGELVATLTLTLKQPSLRRQALGVISTFVSLLQEDQLARGLQQLVLMLLPCLPSHPRPVVRILESLVIHPCVIPAPRHTYPQFHVTPALHVTPTLSSASHVCARVD